MKFMLDEVAQEKLRELLKFQTTIHDERNSLLQTYDRMLEALEAYLQNRLHEMGVDLGVPQGGPVSFRWDSMEYEIPGNDEKD